MDAGESINLIMQVKYIGDYRLVTISTPGKAAKPLTNLEADNGRLSFIFTLDFDGMHYNGLQCELEAGDVGAFSGPCRDASMNEYHMSLSPLVAGAM